MMNVASGNRDSLNPSGAPARTARSLVERLYERFEREVCPVCVHRTAGGGCSVKAPGDSRPCPAFEWAAQLGELLQGVSSSRLGDYADRIQATICPECRQDATGVCSARERLDCPLDMYIGLIIPIIEEELRAMETSHGSRAPGPVK